MPEKKTRIGKDGLPRTVVRSESSNGGGDDDYQDRGIELQGGSSDAASVDDKARRQRILRLLVACVGLLVLALVGWGVTMLVTGDPDRTVREALQEQDDGMGEKMLSAEQVARAFVAETDPDTRLSYVRDAGEVKGRIGQYPEQARSHPVTAFKALGHGEAGGRAVSSYAVKFADGSFRLLSVVQTDAGPKVDWDSYARYCSASWQDLFSGKATEAEVRVFVRPGDYHVGRFRDRSKWTCFKLETPDSDRSIYAYAPAGSALSKRMQTAVMRSRSLRQHMTLKIRSEEGSGKDALFVIDELLAMGWVVE